MLDHGNFARSAAFRVYLRQAFCRNVVVEKAEVESSERNLKISHVRAKTTEVGNWVS